MNSMQRPGLFFLVHRLLPGFELQTSDVSINVTDEDAGELAYRQSNNFHRFNRTDLIYRQIGLHSKKAYRIQTFYTKETITTNRRIRFQRSTQQMRQSGVPEAGDRRVAVSDSNVQHSNCYIGQSITSKSAYQIPTLKTTESITSDWRIEFQLQHNRLVHRRISVPATGARRPAIGNRRPAHHVHQLPTVDVDKTDRRSLDQLRSIDGDRPSTPCSQR